MRRSWSRASVLARVNCIMQSSERHVSSEMCLLPTLLDEYGAGSRRQLEYGTGHPFAHSCTRVLQWRGFASKAEEYNVISVETGLVVIEGYDEAGFIVNGAYVEGAIMCSGQLLTLWRAKRLEEVTQDSLALLLAAKPAPDLLVLGCGPKIAALPQEISDWLARHGIALEALDTGNAVSTYNILSQEGRKVVAALLPSG